MTKLDELAEKFKREHRKNRLSVNDFYRAGYQAALESEEVKKAIRVLNLIIDTHKKLGPDQSQKLRRPEIMIQVELALKAFRGEE